MDAVHRPTARAEWSAATGRLEARGCRRLERPCRRVPRPALSDERVQLDAAGQVELRCKTPWRDGSTHLLMSPLEFMQRLAALVPRPKLHLISFHGVVAPNAKLRAPFVPQGPRADEEPSTDVVAAAECEVGTVQVRPHHMGGARLLKRVFDIAMQHGPELWRRGARDRCRLPAGRVRTQTVLRTVCAWRTPWPPCPGGR